MREGGEVMTGSVADPFVRTARFGIAFGLLVLSLLAVTLRQTASAVGAEVDALLQERRDLERLRAEREAEVLGLRAPERIEAAVALLGRPRGPE